MHVAAQPGAAKPGRNSADPILMGQQEALARNAWVRRSRSPFARGRDSESGSLQAPTHPRDPEGHPLAKPWTTPKALYRSMHIRIYTTDSSFIEMESRGRFRLSS